MDLPLQTKIRQILGKKEYRVIIENILSLFSLQGFNYLLPLFTFPYLTRVLGPDKYGTLAFAIAFISYFQIITDYGFNLSATREVSIHRNDHKKVSKIYSSVMATKSILMVISLITLTLFVFSFEKFRSEWLLYIFTFGLVIGNLLLPTWFFQGMEKMRYISILNICISLIYTVSIFIFVKNSSDYLYVPLINSIGSIMIGIYSIKLVRRQFNVKFCRPSIYDIIHQMKNGWHVFISLVAISFYTTSNTFVLGFFTSTTTVGYYSVAEKIVKMVLGLINPISQSLYPYISSLATKSKDDGIKFIKKIAILIGFFTFIASIFLLLGAGTIISILAGNQFSHSITLLQILSFLPFIIGLSTVFGVLFLIAFGYSNKVSKIQLVVGLCYPLLLIPMVYYFKDIGTALSFLIVETLITLSFWKLSKNVVNEMKKC
ncbi:MAG: flippase [Methanobacterium sp.]|jgi:PST family polysaccharide transporter|nr:flippase [Methanobacterium sp.]